MNASELKLIVQQKYGKIAASDESASGSSCCTTGCCSPEGISTFNESYDHLDGYVPDADLSLGCGIPVEYADIRPGDYVLDLGSGAGNDCFIARAAVGDTGHVTGIDFTEEMVQKAEENRKKLRYTNIDFVRGDIEAMPMPDNSFDVVVSNCVLNLVPDKQKAFSQIMRVLKPGGHFCVSDIVLRGELSDEMRADAELYAGCVAGASQFDDYTGLISRAGFEEIRINKEKQIQLPVTVKHDSFENNKAGIFSITITAHKPQSANNLHITNS